ncbi:hypothetical protein ABZT02_07185 [Streptomyces sp. NPDC005402]|uniref:hypothetical protein n=1 Tax=Streptomyces sp. NPDC005402 TaxID=3155338 RepID=UPI0033A6F93F
MPRRNRRTGRGPYSAASPRAARLIWRGRAAAPPHRGPPRSGDPPPGYRQDSEGLLELIAQWREAALQIGEFAPERPTLRLVGDTAPPS